MSPSCYPTEVTITETKLLMPCDLLLVLSNVPLVGVLLRLQRYNSYNLFIYVIRFALTVSLGCGIKIRFSIVIHYNSY